MYYLFVCTVLCVVVCCIFLLCIVCILNIFLSHLWLHSFLPFSILDWDVHYGQGVADIISKLKNNENNENKNIENNENNKNNENIKNDNNNNIRYVSIHQSGAFPYEGEKSEIKGENIQYMLLFIVLNCVVYFYVLYNINDILMYCIL